MPKIIHSTGPASCDYALIAERPGKVESHVGRVLCGPSGEETDHYLRVNAGIDRASIFCSNVVMDYRNDEPPSPEELQRDRPNLERELAQVKPRYILAMGLYAARWFLGDEIEMEWANGLAFSWRNGYVMPVFHAAAGLHQPSVAAKVAFGFEQFGKLCRGEEMPVGHLRDTIPKPEYRELSGTVTVFDTAGVDTEGSVEHPWCLSFSSEPGRAFVSRKGCDGLRSLSVLHNAIHDLPVLTAMGVTPAKFTDTMLMAALLGVEPLGLKSLARRWCGMKMQTYSDVVAPARREKALQYLSRVLDYIGGT